MSASVGTQWEPRATGNSTQNASAFDPAYGGVDYSQQDSPQATYTDLVLTVMAAPPAPACQVLAGGGTIPAGTYYVTVTWVNTDGSTETTVSLETVCVVALNGRIQVTSPVSVGGADQYKIYMSTTSGSNMRLQNGTNLNVGDTYIITAYGSGNPLAPSTNNMWNQVSSAIRPFVANDKGNFFYLTGGSGGFSGFTGVRYQIQNVVGGVATLDHRAGNASGTSGAARLGGGASGGLTTFNGIVKPGNTIWVKTGQTVTAGGTGWSAGFTGTTAFHIRLIGYGTVRGDSTRATITHNSNGTQVFNLAGTCMHVLQLEVIGAGASSGLYLCNWGMSSSVVENCVFRDEKNVMNQSGSACIWTRCYFKNGGDANFITPGSSGFLPNWCYYCRFSNAGAGGSGTGYGVQVGDGSLTVQNCIIDRNKIGVLASSHRQYIQITATTIDANTTAGIQIGLAAQTLSANSAPWGNTFFRQCIITNNAIGVSNVTQYTGTTTYQAMHYSCNAFYGNTTNYSGLVTSPDDVFLSVDPYTSQSTGNYALNSNSGGGTSVKAMNCPGSFADGVNIITGGVGFGGVDQSVSADPPIANFEEVLFPVDIARGAVGGPSFRTTVVITSSAAEQRIAQWADPLFKWEIASEQRTQGQIQTLIAFFVARLGRATGFRFKDWTDYTLTLQDALQLTTTTFQIQKAYASGTVTRLRKIKKPVAGTVHVFNASSVEQLSGWTVDTTTGIITFSVAPGYIPKVTCEFDVPVRFDTDEMRVVKTDVNIHDWEAVPVVELKY